MLISEFTLPNLCFPSSQKSIVLGKNGGLGSSHGMRPEEAVVELDESWPRTKPNILMDLHKLVLFKVLSLMPKAFQ